MERSQNLSDGKNSNLLQYLIQERFLKMGFRELENIVIASLLFNLASFRYSINMDYNSPSNNFKILIKS